MGKSNDADEGARLATIELESTRKRRGPGTVHDRSRRARFVVSALRSLKHTTEAAETSREAPLTRPGGRLMSEAPFDPVDHS
jgi:hypothetical protein